MKDGLKPLFTQRLIMRVNQYVHFFPLNNFALYIFAIKASHVQVQILRVYEERSREALEWAC